MTDTTLREHFAALHRPGQPLLLYNVWDAGSAKAVAAAGAPALATGSHSLAGAQGYPDGEQIPLNLMLDVVRRIVASVEVPLTVDFEGGYAADAARLADHARYLAEAGAVGCNFEDQVLGGEGLHPVAHQAARIAAVAASGLFVNARTDLFLERYRTGASANDRSLMGEALERAAAYAEAGASCFFAPALSDPELIAELCRACPLPVNILMLQGVPEWPVLAQAGVARISWGGGPWRVAMEALTERATALYR
jgi:2-methylisocitrate lyase-like PEP mutase family enzyme